MTAGAGTTQTATGRALAWMITVALALAACVYQGFHVWVATQSEDTNHLETPLALAVARQVHDGTATLYGPYSGEQPLVLVHAPLYYRLAGLGGWALTRLGVDPMTAALASGRGLSLIAFAGLLWAVARIARLDGASLWAGAWAVLLVTGSPITGSLPVTVRADLSAVALQTFGVALALRPLLGGRAGWVALSASYACFALAFCTKQHAVAAAVVTSLALLAGALRGRVRWGPLLAAHGIAALLVAAYFAIEQRWTAGRMVEAVFILPGRFRSIAGASWSYAAQVGVVAARRSAGLLALALAALLVGRRRALGNRLDALLWLYLLAELGLAALLCRNSEGAWVNYALPAVVFGSIWVGRALARIVEAPGLGGAMVIGLAALVPLAIDAYLVVQASGNRARAAVEVAAVLDDPEVAADGRDRRYFVGDPSRNRLFGNVALAHDEWLYARFEAVGAAEPRSKWLRRALVRGPVRWVIVPIEENKRAADQVEGLDEPLEALGYNLMRQLGRLCVWRRADAPVEDGRGPAPPGT
jgi:hypothetical protein